MSIKKLFLSLIITTSICFISITNAASITGGDAASAASADTFVDVVFAIDNSGSMGDEATSISNNVQAAVERLECLDINIWVKARFTGLTGPRGGLFDEAATTILATAGDATTINDSEDNGPVVYDFSIATNYWQGPAVGGQTYRKAVVTIGDEGLQDGGGPQNQADYDVGKAANDAAIANQVVVFSIIGNNPNPGAPELFTALAEGGANLGGHQFNNTGGFAINSTDQGLQAEMERVLCTAATVRITSSEPIPTLSGWMMVFFATLLAYFGYFRIARRRS